MAGGVTLPPRRDRSPIGDPSPTVTGNSGFPGQVAKPETGSTRTTMVTDFSLSHTTGATAAEVRPGDQADADV
jgi:hypothetical protein